MPSDILEVFQRAALDEKRQSWLEAARRYREALHVASSDSYVMGELHERAGWAISRAALQADEVKEFRERMSQSREAYEAARESYLRLDSPGIQGRVTRCESMVAYADYWLGAPGRERTTKLRQAWQIATAAMNSFAEAGDMEEYTRTFDQVAWSVWVLTYSEWSFQDRKRVAQEAAELARKAAEHRSRSDDPWAAARTLASCAVVFAVLCRDVDAMGDRGRQALEYWSKAETLSEEATYSGIVPSLVVPSLWGDGTDESIRCLRKALEHCKKTNDRFVTGVLLTGLAFHLWWKGETLEDSDQRIALYNAALENAEAANRELTRVSFFYPSQATDRPEVPHPVHYWALARVETDPENKRQLLQKVLEYAPELLARATEAGFAGPLGDAHWVVGNTLTALARLEARPEAQRALLEQALEHGNEYVQLYAQYWPTMWCFGDALDNLALVKDQLASLETDPASKEKLLREAVRHKDECLGVVLREKDLIERTGEVAAFAAFSWFGRYQYEYGGLLVRLYHLTKDPGPLRRAAEVFEQAVDSFRRPKILSRVAEALWKAAQVYDALGEHAKSAERFDAAAATFQEAAERLPQLRSSYDDYAAYMQAWREIEWARHRHRRGEYGLAKEHYEKAAAYHDGTRKWRFLSSDYSAWAKVEDANDLSRQDLPERAQEAFRDASRLFAESKVALQAEQARLEGDDVREMVARIIRAADSRREFCESRVLLEGAKLLDRRGDHAASAESYGDAANRFERLVSALEDEQDRQEIRLTAALARAWEAMAKAEADISPELYEAAAGLFEEARRLATSDKGKLLAHGHSRFCSALAAGTRFADTADAAFHDDAVRHLEAAAKYYLKAGYRDAAEYAKASKLLFDAYAHMDDAAREKDQAKKAKLYALAEKVLEASAEAYRKANHPSKEEQVRQLLEKAREERQLAVALVEVLERPAVVAAMDTFSSPGATRESAVGLERFEHADVQASVIARKKDLHAGEDLDLEIEMVNAGRRPAQLVKIEDLVPEGFEITAAPDMYRVEDSFLNMKGKRLDALKTEKVKLTLRPSLRGQFSVRPRILYLDEGGKYKSHQPEAVDVTVKPQTMVSAVKVVATDTSEAKEAHSLIAGLGVVTLSRYRVVGNYVRYDEAVRNTLKDARQKIVAAFRSPSQMRENYLVWGPSGSGKTYFVQQLAALLESSVRYCEFNLTQLDERKFRSALAELRGVREPCLCFVDEVDVRPNESWPYEVLLPYLDAVANEGVRFIFVLAGSSGSSLPEMKKSVASRPKGADMLSRIPSENEYSIPPMSVGDRLLVVLRQLRQAGKEMGREVREVERLGLYYVALDPRLSSARQLRECAVRCAERMLQGDDRLKYDNLFSPGDPQNKLFWTQALQNAADLVDSFLLVED